ncbi:hypothetical protein FMN50_19800 [Rhodobacterales bacterium]|nr:hypothetical protein FMN50_19800 [Rhodobacterales bacterium]
MAFHQDLQTVVDWAWLNRLTIIEKAKGRGPATHRRGQFHYNPDNDGIWEIYGFICGNTEGGTVGDDQMRKFRRTLTRKLHKWLAPDPEYVLQNGWKNLNSPDDLKELSWKSSFLHVCKNRSLSCAERVYLNLKEETRAEAFCRILVKIWHLPGLSSAKVATPGSTKTDTVVIYLDHRQTRKEVVTIITAYQQRHLGYFGSELPKMVATTGNGIGHGAEPPGMHPLRPNGKEFQGIERSQSFSFYRATLLFIALENTCFSTEGQTVNIRHAFNRKELKELTTTGKVAQPSKHEFEKQVLKLFHLAGLSTHHPERQKDAKFVDMPPPPPPPGRPPRG